MKIPTIEKKVLAEAEKLEANNRKFKIEMEKMRLLP
jgi:hypothetical protein